MTGRDDITSDVMPAATSSKRQPKIICKLRRADTYMFVLIVFCIHMRQLQTHDAR